MNILALDFGGALVKHGIVTCKGGILAQGAHPAPRDTLLNLITLIRDIYAGYADFSPIGIAISTPGSPDEPRGIIISGGALGYLHNAPFAELLFKEIPLPMHMANDGNCAAMGEMWLGAAKGLDKCLFVIIGTGIGSGIVRGGVLEESNPYCGEFGRIIMQSNFSGGEFRNFHNLGSMGSLVRRVNAAIQGLPGEVLNGRQIFERADSGCAICIAEINAFYEGLAMGIFNISLIYGGQPVLLGGGVSARDDLIPNIQSRLAVLQKHFDFDPAEMGIELGKCRFGNDANLIGATYHFLYMRGLLSED